MFNGELRAILGEDESSSSQEPVNDEPPQDHSQCNSPPPTGDDLGRALPPNFVAHDWRVVQRLRHPVGYPGSGAISFNPTCNVDSDAYHSLQIDAMSASFSNLMKLNSGDTSLHPSLSLLSSSSRMESVDPDEKCGLQFGVLPLERMATDMRDLCFNMPTKVVDATAPESRVSDPETVAKLSNSSLPNKSSYIANSYCRSSGDVFHHMDAPGDIDGTKCKSDEPGWLQEGFDHQHADSFIPVCQHCLADPQAEFLGSHASSGSIDEIKFADQNRTMRQFPVWLHGQHADLYPGHNGRYVDESDGLFDANLEYLKGHYRFNREDPLVTEHRRTYIRSFLGEYLHDQSAVRRLDASYNNWHKNTSVATDFTFPQNGMASFVPSFCSNLTRLQNKQLNFLYPDMVKFKRSVGSYEYPNLIPGAHLELSLLDRLKRNRTAAIELADLVDHVVEFSTDQYGSRFIQQKLENASHQEKANIFLNILDNALYLTTDVFGNYVIQKFFELGTERQRSQLMDQLSGHVLELTFQMYGCRVIQKALETVGMHRKIHIVMELDGSVIRCIGDQNGNHVIQKCIQCIPEERIQFIIAPILEQVLILSIHQYGCRVIQRILEHCNDPRTIGTVIDEIMGSISMLTQDQYGNYVVQHVLQHGSPEERSAIIQKLAGWIVKLSQQKFASNVVEKCLAFGTVDERQLLINEVVGSADGNQSLQVMMKDQFGNYVVQKVLETCNEQMLKHVLCLIRAHLNELKCYTYGKHIVSRIEKLIATGEKRIAAPAGTNMPGSY